MLYACIVYDLTKLFKDACVKFFRYLWGMYKYPILDKQRGQACTLQVHHVTASWVNFTCSDYK